jgi:hypothetical protein
VPESTQQSLLDILDSDRRGIGELAAQLASEDSEYDREVETPRLVREIVQHNVACERYLHPLIERLLPDGKSIAHSQFGRHRELEDLLRELEHSNPESAEFRTTLDVVARSWNENTGYLEAQIFPALRTGADAATLAKLGDLALEAESAGPTRPRALSVQEPVLGGLISLAQGFVDRTIDAISGRGHAGSEQIHELLRDGHYDLIEDPAAPPGDATPEAGETRTAE